LSHDFTLRELKAQHKKLVKKCHPDISTDLKEKKKLEEKFKEVMSAYKTLENFMKKT
jgi:curved DNA-binding protein CbpA